MYISYKHPTNQLWNCDEMDVQTKQIDKTKEIFTIL